MKVIDLLNKIANDEEVPEYIKVYNDSYEYESFNKLYWNSNNKQLLENFNGNILNYEVEIIEEKKIPKKIDNAIFERAEEKYRDKLCKDKIDEIIDYLQYLKSKGDE